MSALPRLAITLGEPAGIGPELVAELAHSDIAADLIAIGDANLLQSAAASRGLRLDLIEDDGQPLRRRMPGSLRLVPEEVAAAVVPGRLDRANAGYVLSTLARASDGCMAGEFDAVVTAPVQKSIINDAGIPFSGHTEYFALRANADVVMMLAAGNLRVALATTHLPLAAVPAAITREKLETTLRIVHADLQRRFALAQPRILVLGLNPHAGEGGHLGREEIDVIAPLLADLRDEGFALTGPLPADTAFLPGPLAEADAVLAMYHDQGLPVLKALGFGQAVNLTLGLPFIRTSVDHGTALDLAGRNRADAGSLLAATRLALELALKR
ncbi:MAG: 4-hydroxythreonine-4-phosphate dehydrogenase PdxA [Lysobacterales bacterium 69-70]|nr:4-hydroxythreonine-4-phosphate dehydrogenase PdxA [Xanthomonadaceae bacterium]ODU32360.1 MAG: 4-hydroxythreonine-4-phosphate dehydrogenase PdxA [Xanthomonadaceae bacterium SCN 69-320]ODV15827.1 MAG: 4-hydroxythreonine-4-phosphate dehydrogenase PdxA [Xanthomonadaceae bacterium SCN 69-25]OJY95467.1 MAG: 4-hydroxythreonine-4-phosphate dehydrogenase PdxA [Xanthomonadales bacterium 69-70]